MIPKKNEEKVQKTNKEQDKEKEIVIMMTMRRGVAVLGSHQYVRGSKEVAEGVVEQVDEGGGVQVGVAHHLRRKQSLTGAAAEQTPHHAVAHVHVVGHFLQPGHTGSVTAHIQQQEQQQH